MTKLLINKGDAVVFTLHHFVRVTESVLT